MPTAYNIQRAPDRRAGCSDTICKTEKVKFNLGEMRFGVWVEVSNERFESQRWVWRHW
jgi:hypothetical protein